MRLAIITGGSRGLGRALCDVYLAQGWSVLEFSRTAPHPFSVPVDLSDPTASADIFARSFESIARADLSEVVAIGNAAVLGPVGPVEHASADMVTRTLNINIVSAILFARAFVSSFQDAACPKTFVNISSGAAAKGYAGWSLYCACKAALENYVRSVALEQDLRPHPVRAISINPGVMDTAMQTEVRAASPADFPQVDRFLRLHREGQLAAPTAVASRIADIVASRPQPGGVYSVSL